MAFHNPSTVRSEALRSSAFCLEKAFSMGLKLACPLKSDPPGSMAFEPDGGTWNA